MTASADVGFVHLRVHTAYSLLEGALPIKRLAKLAAADRQPALGIADTGNLFGALEFSEAMAEVGIQPIVGCQLAVDFGEPVSEARGGQAARGRFAGLVLIAASETGYGNLVRLVSRSFIDTAPDEKPHILLPWLEGAGEGLIALSGGPGGPLDQAIQAGRDDLAADRLDRLQELFGDRLYLEVQRHGLAAEDLAEAQLVDLAYAHGIPLVATNECFFGGRDDYEAHDALICIAEGRVIAEPERRRLSPEHYFKPRAEMVRQFADLPEALESTVEIALRCGFRPMKRKPILPRFAASDGDADAAEAALLRDQAHAGLTRRLAVQGLAPGRAEPEYRERLDYELSVISRMKYPGYFLIVADFIQWAKKEGIPVGPGRGSGAGSVVAWALTITDLDPIRFGLLFERFLNPERVSMPDFDVDFCQDQRDRVIEYVRGRYGAEQVAQIITFGTLQARAVLRDVGRVLEMPYGQVDRLCKLVPQNPANPVTLGKAIADEPRLQAARAEEPVVARLFDIAERLEGLYRHASTHAAGIVIGDRPLDRLVPLYRDPRSPMPVTQFNMKWVENAGLVKFDFLGLKTLTVLDATLKLLRRRGVDLDLSTIPLDDQRTYQMLARGETVGVFQVESAGMRRALIDMRPDRFEDLIVLVALYRPGPMANIPTYCSRKLGREKTEYLHPKLEPILEATFGIITYQEQVMRIAQDLAGYSLGEADLLRRAMGKKIRAEMEKQRVRFMSGAMERGIGKDDAEAIFEACAKFADYGFNKSHSAPYALITYQTAYLKANHPVEFMAASMTLDNGNTDKLSDFRREALRLGIPVDPPSVTYSGVAFDVAEGRIRYALAAVKGVGQQAVEHIVAARQARPFRDLADFAGRINPRLVNKRALESLVAAGALDRLEPDRARLTAGLDRVLGLAARRLSAAEDGQNELFGGSPEDERLVLPAAEPWLPAERLQREHAAVGFYLSAHPLDEYRAVLERKRVQSWAAFGEAVRRGASAGRLAGTVIQRQERRTRTGNKMGILRMSDPTGEFEAILFSETLAQYRDLLEPGRSVVILVGAEERPEGISVRIQSVEPLDGIDADLRHMRIFLREATPLPRLERLMPPKGEAGISFVLMLEEGRREVEVQIPGRFSVSPQVAGAFKALPGVVEVELA